MYIAVVAFQLLKIGLPPPLDQASVQEVKKLIQFSTNIYRSEIASVNTCVVNMCYVLSNTCVFPGHYDRTLPIGIS